MFWGTYMEQVKDPTANTQPLLKCNLVFSNKISDLFIPVYGNVLCKKKNENRYCYAFLNKGKLYTGYCFGDNDYQYELDPSVWEVYEVLKK